MVRSRLVKSVCVAIALSGFSPPPAGAVIVRHGPAGGVGVHGRYGGGVYRGPHGNVYGHGPYRGGAVYRGGAYRYGGWARPGWTEPGWTDASWAEPGWPEPAKLPTANGRKT